MTLDTGLKAIEFQTPQYLLKLANNEEDLRAVQQLRGDVFYRERFEKGHSSESPPTEMKLIDSDQFDPVCDHLMLICKRTKQIVGTYRIQTYNAATQGYGFYSSQEFDLRPIPGMLLQSAIEIGRACIAREHRCTRALMYLWKGLANYMVSTQSQYLFGCSSLPTQNPWEAACSYHYFQEHGFIHPKIHILPRNEYSLDVQGSFTNASDAYIPALLKQYLRIGAKVCSLPAIDREFGVIDFLTLLDIHEMGKKYYSFFFQDIQ